MYKSFSKPLIFGCFSLAITSMLPSCIPANVGYSSPQGNVNVGYEAQSLPVGYRTEIIGGTTYFTHNGNFYRPRGGGRYVVVAPPRRVYAPRVNSGAVITRLPAGYRVVNHRGIRYYQHRNVFYQQRGSGFVVVGRPY